MIINFQDGIMKNYVTTKFIISSYITNFRFRAGAAKHFLKPRAKVSCNVA